MKHSLENGVLTIYLEGRIDSNNSEAVASEMQSIVDECNPVELVLDAEELEYISSAGLRIVLRFRKANSRFKIINVSTDVYEIFDMTGFTEMMKVEKAFRKLSVDGCEIIGEGANGKVYRIDADTIVKVYTEGSFEDIQRERALAKKAFVLGINTAISYDIAKIGDCYGTVFELLNAKSLASCIADDPEHLDHYVELYVDLLKKIHATEDNDGDMPDMKELALKWVEIAKTYLDEESGKKLEKLVNDIPKSNHILHGDYHLKNVMIQNDEALLIDMDTLALGNPVFEFGFIFNAYIGFYSLNLQDAGKFLKITAQTSFDIWDKTLQLYFGTTDKAVLDDYTKKAKVIGYIRLLQRAVRRTLHNGEDHSAAIAFYKQELTKLVAELDSLAF
ncbi:MAG: phosphotransferase [Clostridia bacterium]|nr:phosphotransferase [Clostridia bacterium]